jgi:hypothetical protein
LGDLSNLRFGVSGGDGTIVRLPLRDLVKLIHG